MAGAPEATSNFGRTEQPTPDESSSQCYVTKQGSCPHTRTSPCARLQNLRKRFAPCVWSCSQSARRGQTGNRFWSKNKQTRENHVSRTDALETVDAVRRAGGIYIGQHQNCSAAHGATDRRSDRPKTREGPTAGLAQIAWPRSEHRTAREQSGDARSTGLRANCPAVLGATGRACNIGAYER